MSFISGIFFVFLPAVCLVYFLVPQKARWIVLLAASLVFYLSWGLQAFPVVLACTLLAYGAALWMDGAYEKLDREIRDGELDAAAKKEKKLKAKAGCRRILTGAAALLIAVLVYTKVGDALLDGLVKNWRLRSSAWLQVTVPLGISYYTFSMISYLADVYWRKDRAERNFLRFLLWVLFFPKILQGPIARHKKLARQLAEGQPFDFKRVCFGMQLALWGYFKKLVIADRLAVFVETVFAGCYEESGSLIFVVAAMLGSVQLYCDFSGCMDMASGFCQILGIELDANFNHPFFSRSAAEFWRRWHITLGSWFKDYVYMPLAVSPRLLKPAGKVRERFGARASRNLMVIIPSGIVWILTGLWHGTGYNYIAWGLYWGALIIGSSVFAPEIKRLTELLRIHTETPSWHVFQMVRTFLLFSFGRLLTLPGHLRTTLDILKKIAQKCDIWILFDGTLYEYGLNEQNFRLAILGIFVLWCVSMLQERGSLRERIAGYNLPVRWGIYYAAFFAVVILGVWGSGAGSVAFSYMNY